MRVYFSLPFVLIFAATSFAYADTTTLTPASCDQLYNLPQGTIATAASSNYLNSTTCGDYQYLIALYTPGSCSSVGFTNAKVQGITSLNTDFAQRLTNMLQAASNAGFTITINSAFRTTGGEKCANPNGFGGNYSASMHTKGLAADLQYPGDSDSAHSCDSGKGSAAYQWVAANAKNFGLGLYDQLHTHVNGECNHVEAATAVAGGVGPGGGGSASSNTNTALNNLLSPNGSQGIPSGYCIVSTNPLAYAPCNNALFSQPAPIAQPTQIAQQIPPPSASSVLTSPTANPVAAAPTITPLTIAQTQPIVLPISNATSVQQIWSQLTSPSTATTSHVAISLFLSTSSSVYTILQGVFPASTSTASTSLSGTGAYEQTTFTSNLPQYSPQPASALSQLFSSLQSALLGLLNYLRTL